jgi:hypothetical protein
LINTHFYPLTTREGFEDVIANLIIQVGCFTLKHRHLPTNTHLLAGFRCKNGNVSEESRIESQESRELGCDGREYLILAGFKTEAAADAEYIGFFGAG